VWIISAQLRELYVHQSTMIISQRWQAWASLSHCRCRHRRVQLFGCQKHILRARISWIGNCSVHNRDRIVNSHIWRALSGPSSHTHIYTQTHVSSFERQGYEFSVGGSKKSGSQTQRFFCSSTISSTFNLNNFSKTFFFLHRYCSWKRVKISVFVQDRRRAGYEWVRTWKLYNALINRPARYKCTRTFQCANIYHR
jgi:hypothetical protein